MMENWNSITLLFLSLFFLDVVSFLVSFFDDFDRVVRKIDSLFKYRCVDTCLLVLVLESKSGHFDCSRESFTEDNLKEIRSMESRGTYELITMSRMNLSTLVSWLQQ